MPGLAAIQPTIGQKTQAMARDFSANWFAAYTQSHHEKRVAAHFAERQVESFVPVSAAHHRWKNRCEMNLELPLFSNYVYVPSVRPPPGPPSAELAAPSCRATEIGVVLKGLPTNADQKNTSAHH